jgi:hypothetical protein
MRRERFFLILLVLAALMTMSPALAAADKHVRVSVYDEGHAYCPPRNAVIANMAVRGGRCYRVAAVRNARGVFLAFLDPAARIPAGRLEHLSGDDGRRITSHIIYLIPLPATSQLMQLPVNTIQLIRLREEDEEGGDNNNENGQNDAGYRTGHLVVFLPNAPTPNVSVTIAVTF